MTTVNDKTRLRREFLERRNSLTVPQIRAWSSIIQDKVINRSEYKSASAIGVYFPFNSEVMTQAIIGTSLGRKKIGLPRIVGNQIKFYEIASFDWLDQLSVNKYGIKEPIISNDISESISLLIIPGTVFDSEGYRLGYGKGYYDRFISHMKQLEKPPFTIGLAFDLQIFDGSLPYTKLDERMNMIVTERRIISVNRTNQ